MPISGMMGVKLYAETLCGVLFWLPKRLERTGGAFLFQHNRRAESLRSEFELLI
jgi:hypothetical protein